MFEGSWPHSVSCPLQARHWRARGCAAARNLRALARFTSRQGTAAVGACALPSGRGDLWAAGAAGHSGAPSPLLVEGRRWVSSMSGRPMWSRSFRCAAARFRRALAAGVRYGPASSCVTAIPVRDRRPPSNVGGGLPICPQMRVNVGHSGALPPAFAECRRRSLDRFAQAAWLRPF